MLDSLLEMTIDLKQYDNKASYFIAKEIVLIQVSLLWYPEKLKDNVERLRSLANHVRVTFPNNNCAKNLTVAIRETSKSLSDN